MEMHVLFLSHEMTALTSPVSEAGGNVMCLVYSS
jgi:hypothetical protein